ncbi:DUF1853 family protein [Seongchinamella unica]|uniref:DUF1853 family protein n=1 Tax=Seongchinamella unica TaxID=2547392 RepID=A0A4R5LNT7_9GAMM|nr:DUF1853 family protein [Seongchinamella unica]TDG11940.1 DUF1853 family protein [Seongchinamella unica]
MNAFAENTLLELQTPEVRDLAWACFSPPLFHASKLARQASVSNCHFSLTAARRQWLRQLDRQPQALLQFIAAGRSTRLGIYFESLWQFFLSNEPQVELLASNLPVRAGGKTLGEFDLVYFCHRRQRPVHLELALKFYLCAPGMDGSEWQHWLGPNVKDRLDRKLTRMLEHQARLSEQAQAREVLAALGVESPLREVEVKGRLYRQYAVTTVAPPAYNTQLALQQWAHASTATAILGDLSHRRLARRQWLAPLAGNDSPAGREQTGTAANSPGQFALVDDWGRERQRLFVVADEWPQTDE